MPLPQRYNSKPLQQFFIPNKKNEALMTESLSELSQLKRMTTVVADTGDIEEIARLKPSEATTNPSLILKAATSGRYDRFIEDARRIAESPAERIDRVLTAFGAAILEHIPGRVSTEVDARLSFNTAATIEKARRIISLYEAMGISRERILIKIAATWEGCEAARVLEAEGIHCNMTLIFALAQAEASAQAGATLISPFVGRIYDFYKAKAGAAWDEAVAYWKTLPTDADAVFDKEVTIDSANLVPYVTWGTNPGQACPVTGRVPDPADIGDPGERAGVEAALAYIGLEPGSLITDAKIDTVFIGSCTNGRIEDFREAAKVVKGRKVAPGVRALAVPGSMAVRAQAEAEGLDKIFIEAGFEWRLPGCSMCLAMNDDRAEEGSRVASTSNRNFVGRQGRGSRTHLMSPAMAAAAAVTGHITDVRELL